MVVDASVAPWKGALESQNPISGYNFLKEGVEGLLQVGFGDGGVDCVAVRCWLTS